MVNAGSHLRGEATSLHWSPERLDDSAGPLLLRISNQVKTNLDGPVVAPCPGHPRRKGTQRDVRWGHRSGIKQCLPEDWVCCCNDLIDVRID